MIHPLIDAVEKSYLKSSLPEFHIGDTVNVLCRIVEGDKERVQGFNGTVIARRGQGVNESVAVRRLVGKEGVERIFLVHSPNVVDIRLIRRGKVRRAKLYYLRARVGKARKLRELRVQRKTDERETVAATT